MRDSQRAVYWIRRLSEIAMLGWLGIMLLGDLGVAVSLGGLQWLVFLAGNAGIAAVILRRRHRVQTFAAMLFLSIAISMLLWLAGASGVPGAAETGALLVLMLGVLRHVEPVRNAAVLTLAGLIVLMAAAIARGSAADALIYSFMLFAGWSTIAGVGGYLRFQQERRVVERMWSAGGK